MPVIDYDQRDEVRFIKFYNSRVYVHESFDTVCLDPEPQLQASERLGAPEFNFGFFTMGCCAILLMYDSCLMS